MTIETKYNIDDIVYIKPLFRGLTPFKVIEIKFSYHKNNQSTMELNVHYTLYNKQIDRRESYVREDNMFISEAHAIARYMDEN